MYAAPGPLATRPPADPLARRGPHRVDRQLFGIENEYGVTCTFKGQRRLSPDEVARYLFRKVVSWGRSSNVPSRTGVRWPPEPYCAGAAELIAQIIHSRTCAVVARRAYTQLVVLVGRFVAAMGGAAAALAVSAGIVFAPTELVDAKFGVQVFVGFGSILAALLLEAHRHFGELRESSVLALGRAFTIGFASIAVLLPLGLFVFVQVWIGMGWP